MFTSPTGTFDICQKCRRWHKKGNKTHHNIGTHFSNTDSSQQQVEDGQANIVIN